VGGEVSGRHEAERPVDAVVVVVDRLREVNEADRTQSRHRLLDAVEVVRGLERVVTADGDERIDLMRSQRVEDVAEFGVLLAIREVVEGGDSLARVRPRGSEDDGRIVADRRDVVRVRHM